MKEIRIFIFISLVIPSLALACPDSEFESQLKELSTLTPQVLEENPSNDALKLFFEAMPTSFSCFNRLFGYSDKPAPLYSEPELFPLFPKIAQAVPTKEFTAKLISLAVNARWEADQTGALQEAVRSTLDNQTSLFIEILETYDFSSQESVWVFLFDAPHPSNSPIAVSVQKKICELSSKNCALSKSIFAKKIAEEHNH